MSAGRKWIKEYYVGFLLLALSFLYLSHYLTNLGAEYRRAELEVELLRMEKAGIAVSEKALDGSSQKPATIL